MRGVMIAACFLMMNIQLKGSFRLRPLLFLLLNEQGLMDSGFADHKQVFESELAKYPP